ncbi:alpha-keto acid decarboxylase family protein [Providencia burhodogranariea]|uniref:Indole-3-pyruvate decarboxylase n=1 Tax=Providencia burhodogranariea DSM 19968 TaxID=1141662 RepID=K8WY92_9GAMM|nr:thiamine pyrophosphate-binding protein [Providencia burhodogranariea]EKT65573.1 indole-3-pyruvate decarboxylase [Providencia burhodogranariea DSM 19968]
MAKTVIQHVLTRLVELGIRDVFGVAGDYAFPINDAVCENTHLRWIGNCNELNAGYAADGYARIKGISALATTFGVGELSALNAIAGAYAEHVPIFHLVGMPPSRVQRNRTIAHHTLGNGDFDVFYKISQHLSCAHSILTPENCITELERLINSALFERRPVYIGIPSDYALMPIKISESFTTNDESKSNNNALTEAITAILNKLSSSKKACVIAGILTARFGLTATVQSIIDKANLPYATTLIDKSVLSESNPNYIGIYNGTMMNLQVNEFIRNCDCIMGIGAVFSDFSSGCFTVSIPPENYISIMPNHVKVGSAVYSNVSMQDVLSELKQQVPTLNYHGLKAQGLGPLFPSQNGKITAEYLYPRFEKMFTENDIIVTDTGASSMGLFFALLPKNAQFHNQTLWSSIGWSTPAAFGAALAAPHRRIILITGEGSHQLTAQEVSQFARFGLKPIIFIINNEGYLIERLLCKDPEAYYNDIPQWNYTQLPSALGCEDWYCQKVTRCDELDSAIKVAESKNVASYIEIVTDKYASPEFARKLQYLLNAAYSS